MTDTETTPELDPIETECPDLDAIADDMRTLAASLPPEQAAILRDLAEGVDVWHEIVSD